MSFRHKQPMGTFRRGLTISPFQIPLLAYLAIQGFLLIPEVPALVDEMHLEHSWPIWNFVILMIVGGVLSTFSRFNGNERLESLSLYVMSLALVIITWIQIAGGLYDVGGSIAILIGCLLRIRVLGRSRKAEREAIQIIVENNGNHEGEQN